MIKIKTKKKIEYHKLCRLRRLFWKLFLAQVVKVVLCVYKFETVLFTFGPEIFSKNKMYTLIEVFWIGLR